MSKAKRKGKVFVDYLRNDRGSTAIANYSTRARAGAPVATPIRWDELTADLKPDLFTASNVPQRMSQLKRDPWDGFLTAQQSITKKMMQAVRRA
jgi:bifunctional non-homologous end joining protein LigD